MSGDWTGCSARGQVVHAGTGDRVGGWKVGGGWVARVLAAAPPDGSLVVGGWAAMVEVGGNNSARVEARLTEWAGYWWEAWFLGGGWAGKRVADRVFCDGPPWAPQVGCALRCELLTSRSTLTTELGPAQGGLVAGKRGGGPVLPRAQCQDLPARQRRSALLFISEKPKPRQRDMRTRTVV